LNKKPLNSYLAWVGESHYKTCEDFVGDVAVSGVSKKLPGYGMAFALSVRRNTVVWLMHDEGDYCSCESCIGDVNCPSCRTLDKKILLWRGEIRVVNNQYLGEGIPAGKRRIIAVRRKRIGEASSQKILCKDCLGLGIFKCGTGGSVIVDGRKIDYREYKWMIKQPILIKGAIVTVAWRCGNCSGTGKHPRSKLFGFFVPRIEYVMSGDENEVLLEKLVDFDCITPAKESHRSSGPRKPGFYAVTRNGRPTKLTKHVRELAKRLVPGRNFEMIGDFVSFSPVEGIEQRRFRGFKRFPFLGIDVHGNA
jgi:hypothetical protein